MYFFFPSKINLVDSYRLTTYNHQKTCGFSHLTICSPRDKLKKFLVFFCIFSLLLLLPFIHLTGPIKGNDSHPYLGSPHPVATLSSWLSPCQLRARRLLNLSFTLPLSFLRFRTKVMEIQTDSEYEVLICGGGPAGLFAAINLVKLGHRILVIGGFDSLMCD